MLELFGKRQSYTFKEMDSSNRRTGSVTSLLAGGILLVAAAAAVIFFVPLAECPECRGTGEELYYCSFSGYVSKCGWCQARGKLPLIERLTFHQRREAAYRYLDEWWQKTFLRRTRETTP